LSSSSFCEEICLVLQTLYGFISSDVQNEDETSMESAKIYFLTDASMAEKLRRKADHLLVKQAVAGDRRAFQQIVESNKDRMFSVARGVLGNRMLEDSKDVVQEAFIKAYRALPDFRGDASLPTWLYRITYLTAIDHKRQLKRHLKLAQAVEVETQSDAYAVFGTITGGGGDEIEAAQLRADIDAALCSLTKLELTIFALRHMQNFKLHEIAVIVNFTEGAVKNILFNAIRKLRDNLQDSQFPLREAKP
jgi:RNA polymerase sigma-70 factor, ECF subfamily